VQVDTVVEGSLSRVGDGLPVTVQVNRAADGFQMLSRAIDGTAAELARMERDMSLPVVAAIRPSAVATTAGHLPDPEAYELLLKARALRGQSTPDGFHQIVEYLHQAVRRDPQYANAYAALARAYVAAATNTLIEPSAAIPLSHIAVSTALAIDPQSAAAFDAMGFGDAMLELHWKKGEEELRKAVLLMPQDATIRQHLGLVLLCEGRFEEAIEQLQAAADLDPLSPAAGSAVGIAYFCWRRYDDALAQYGRVKAQHPESGSLHVLTGQVYVGKGDFQQGMEEYRKGLDAFHQDKSTLLVHALAMSGRREEARAQLAAVEDPDHPDPIDLAAIYGALGDRDRAFSWLEKGLAKRKVYLVKVHPFLDPLRSDPRYAGLLQRAGF
jgi:tetratricopeptide (TPR) repeat protein